MYYISNYIMAKGQITDGDLLATNIANGVEIFGVTGDYVNMTLDPGLYYLGGPALSWGLGGSGNFIARGYLRFYDDGTKIIIMGCSIGQAQVSSSFYGGSYYYAEILKSTGVITVYPELDLDLGTSTPYGNVKLVYINISGTNRYAFTAAPNDFSNGFVYFNGTQVVGASAAAILAASNIGSSSISYRGKTLSAGTLFSMEDNLFYGAGGACLQTLQYG